MKYLIVGLGNPGPKYDKTRHNVGFIFADFISESHNGNFQKKVFGNYHISQINLSNDIFYIVKTQTFMNNSGQIFQKLYRKTGIEKRNTIVVLDNLDLDIGRVKMKFGGGSAGHNGLKSIINYIGTKDFYRLYFGIGRPEFKNAVISHVLGKFTIQELELINLNIKKVSKSLKNISNKTQEQVICEVNSIR